MADRPVLYSFWISSCAWRVRTALALKGIDVDYVYVNLATSEQFGSKFTELNPSGMVPVLVHKGRAISESYAILEYLEEAFPDKARLLPTDLFKRADVRSIAMTVVSAIQPIQNVRVINYHAPDDPAKKLAMASHFIQRGIQAIEQKLAKTSGKYCVGDEITLADVCLIPQVYNGTSRFGCLDLSLYPHVHRVCTNLLKVDAFRSAGPYSQQDTPHSLKGRELDLEKGCVFQEASLR